MGHENRPVGKGFSDLPPRIQGSDVKAGDVVIQLTRNAPSTLPGAEVKLVLDARKSGRKYRSRNTD